MQKVIIDTNVLISALIQKSYPYHILYDCVIGGKIEVCISEDLMKEYLDVLARPKFAKYPDFVAKAEQVLAQLTNTFREYKPQIKLDIIDDAGDNKLLELADISNADYLLTGNTNDFTMRKYKNTLVVTPKEYWDNCRP